MATILSNNLLVNGLRTEFADTYQAIRNRQSDSRLGMVMDLSIAATNRNHDFAYLNAAPHMTYWERGESIPTDAMDSVQFNVPVYEWARRVPWSKWDRKDDQTQSLFDMARMAGESAALLPERFFFDLLTNSTDTLPAVPNAPDGAAFFTTSTRFGASGGNQLAVGGVATIQQVRAAYYSGLEQFMAFQDGKGQPLLSKETIDGGVLIIHAAADTEIFEETFLQQRQGLGVTTTGALSSSATITSVAPQSNVVQDASRNVQLWGSSRLATGTWYMLLQNPPKQATFLLDREGVQEFSSLESDNNGDHTRSTAEEYVQWECRHGAGIALPYGAIKFA